MSRLLACSGGNLATVSVKRKSTESLKYETSNLVKASITSVSSRFTIACVVILSLKTLPAVAPGTGSSYEDIPGQPGEPYPNMPHCAAWRPYRQALPKDLVRRKRHRSIQPKDTAFKILARVSTWSPTTATNRSLWSTRPELLCGCSAVRTPNTFQGDREVTDKPITHLIYSHSHADHIAGTPAPWRPPDHHSSCGNQATARSARNDHAPCSHSYFQGQVYHWRWRTKCSNSPITETHTSPATSSFMHPPRNTLMVVDVVFPGWMPWRRFALAQDIPGYFAQVKEITSTSGTFFVPGHVVTHWDPRRCRDATRIHERPQEPARASLKSTKVGETLAPAR